MCLCLWVAVYRLPVCRHANWQYVIEVSMCIDLNQWMIGRGTHEMAMYNSLIS